MYYFSERPALQAEGVPESLTPKETVRLGALTQAALVSLIHTHYHHVAFYVMTECYKIHGLKNLHLC